MQISRMILAVFSATVLSLSLASCTSDDSDPMPTASESSGNANTAGPGATGAAGGNDDAAEFSPIDLYFSTPDATGKTPAEYAAEEKVRQAAREEAVAQCMADAGFEYTPDKPADELWMARQALWKPDNKDWVAQYGYGLNQNPYVDSPDPNQVYIDLLSAEEQASYREALYGKASDQKLDANGAPVWESTQTTPGCFDLAYPSTTYITPDLHTRFEEISTVMRDLPGQIDKQPAAIALNGEWSSCMADAGFDFATQLDASDSIRSEITTLYESLAPEDWASGDPSASNPDFIALGEKEITMALADLDCRDRTNYTEARLIVQYELEEQFIKDNATELAEFRSAMQEAQKK